MITTMTASQFTQSACYGPHSVFTPAEQDAMRRGFTTAERIRISGQVFGGFPQAISQTHADKLRQHIRNLDAHIASFLG